MAASRPGGARSAAVIVLLLLTLGLTGVMAWEAHRAARQHQAAARGALDDYARLSAFLYRARGREALLRTAGGRLLPFERVVVPASDAPLPDLADALGREGEACPVCPPLDSVRGYFRVDLRDGRMQTTGGAPSPDLQAWLADTARTLAGKRARTEPSFEFVALFRRVDGRDGAFVYLVRRDPAGNAAGIYGFEAQPRAFVRAAFTPVFGSATVLPPSLTRGLPADSLVSLSVIDGDGRALFESPVRFEEIATARDTLGEMYGGLRLRTGLRASAAERLVIGGVPRSRLPLLAALMALAAGLTAVALMQLRRERELARLRADFVSGVSHELRTPLAQIRMFAETLRLGRVRSEAERARSLEIIDQEARRLSSLVENVLAFSRAERRAVRLSRDRSNLAALIRDAAETFAPLAASRRVSIDLLLDETIEAEVDRDALRQILLNLLDNAVKYGPAGQKVTVGLERAGERARISVDDEGPGIPAKERARVFSPFVRLARDAEGAVAGSGIGLAVVAQLAELHGGRAWAEDAAGGGARFVVDLPTIREMDGAARGEAAARGAA